MSLKALQNLDGRVALVTGGSRGLGLQMAEVLGELGATVVITARKEGELKEAHDTLTRQSIKAEAIVNDLQDTDAVEPLVQGIIDKHGQIDVLVNNAATNPYAGPMIDADLPRWRKTIDVNMTAPFAWTQLVWQKYQKDNGGVVLNISSVGGLETNPMLGVYDVTKAALIHMTKQLAAELAPGVRVNAICPGLIKTDFARMLWEGDAGDMVAQQYPLKRLGEVEDIAGAALYLAADTGSWITGQALVLDGGGQIKF